MDAWERLLYKQVDDDLPHSEERVGLGEVATMETIVLARQGFASPGAVATWANDLIGNEINGESGFWKHAYSAEKVLQFQVLLQADGTYDALFLVAVTLLEELQARHEGSQR
jgi:hypothetical protein